MGLKSNRDRHRRIADSDWLPHIAGTRIDEPHATTYENVKLVPPLAESNGVAGRNGSHRAEPVETNETSRALHAVGDGCDHQAARQPKKHYGVLIGESEPMQALYTKVRQVASLDAAVLIQGESGTGKELLAEAIHVASERKGEYIAVNCGGFSRELLSSELF